jgi:hypothetical protein
MRIPAFALSLILALSWPAIAHEFWIDPLNFQVEPDEPLVADIRVGQNMKGMAFPFVPRSTRRFEVISASGIYAAQSKIGDRPALNELPREEGLAIVVHVTGDNELNYKSLEKFEAFVDHKDLGPALEIHARDGLSSTDFLELYSRYAKSLIGVGSANGLDREFGLETEITALANPYTDDLTDGLPVLLTYQGRPRVDAQIEIFERKPDRSVSVSLVRTNADGIASIPVTKGNAYMLDAVVLRRHHPTIDGGPVWESLWANLTFAVPGDSGVSITE